MNAEKLSMNKIIFITSSGIIFITLIMLALLYLLTENTTIILYSIFFISLMVFFIMNFIALVRKKLSSFSDGICRTLDDMMNNNIDLWKGQQEDTLLAKIEYRLSRLYEAMQENNRRVVEERAALQELISDISHQVKMPIANLKMVHATLLEQNMPNDKQREFIQAMSGQLDKLEFLIQAMIKMSRLETGVITLSKNISSIYETLAAALGGIIFSAESKSMQVSVDCPENLTASHDRKWTAEALFNILDNAVKYTPNGGNIHVTATRWEMYTKIDITDTGKGISERHHADVFKRFYREKEVHDIDGIGIGLYLAREIITMQGGYIKVTSEPGKGSTFSVFLLNRE
jgi:signal transduction histidine kinase